MKVALLAATLASASAFMPSSAPKFGTSLNLKQGFLEYTPYHDHSAVKVNTFKNKAPFTGKVVSNKRIVGPKATGETCHIIIDHKGDFPYIEGQSWGVIPPGTREKDGKPHAVRLYSIASSRYGDDMTGATGSLCVRRATYWCPELKADDPAKKGICSNFLCDAEPGTEINMTGPAGKVMLMPEEDPTTDYIMVATGTGIAPFRDSYVVYSSRIHPPPMFTRVRHGYSLVLPTVTLCCMMMNSKMPRLVSPITSVSIMH
jgi:ferredoxin--NADP+ reductase